MKVANRSRLEKRLIEQRICLKYRRITMIYDYIQYKYNDLKIKDKQSADNRTEKSATFPAVWRLSLVIKFVLLHLHYGFLI